MIQLLKQSTAYTFRFGPFMDKTDGNTQKNSLTIAYTDVLLSKAGGALAAKNDTTALTGTGANAHYTCVLNTTDTNTLGGLRVWCHISADALPVYQDFLVVPANVYDALVAGSDALDVSTIQFAGQTITCSGGVTIPAATIASTTNITAATGVVLSGVTHTGAVIPTVTDVTNLHASAATAANQTTILNRLGAWTGSGLNTVLGAFRALCAKASALTPTDISTGTTFDNTTDSIEALRDRGDAAWITATGFSTHSAADVWAAATRTLTAGTNIALAKGVGVIGFNDVSTSDVTTSCTSALNTYDPPTNAELEARTPSATELAYIVNHAKTAPSVTFTGGTTTTAILGNVDGSAASSVNDFYNGRVLIFNAGTLDEQATDITDYDGATKTATITAVTTAVTAAHTAIMV